MYKNITALFSRFTRKKLYLSITALIVLAVTTGFVGYETTKAEVTLMLDGKKTEVKTHASTVGELLSEQNIKPNQHDVVKPGLSAKVEDNMQVDYLKAKEIVLTIDGKDKKVWTTAKTVEQFVKEQQLSLKEHDVIKPNLTADIQDQGKIKIESAFPVKLVVGGKAQQVWTTSTTVADLLKQQKVSLGEIDRVSPAKTEKLTGKTQVEVIRVEKVTDVVEEETPFATVNRKDSNLTEGKERVVQDGNNGKLEKRYEVVMENGKEVSRKLVGKKTLTESTDKIVAIGTKAKPQPQPKPVVSRSKATSETGGRELTVTSTAYTANCSGCSGITASGYNLKANPNAKVIAVDPNVIPLGSKVYVEGYGYAIASDTGGAIKGNKIDVFFSSQSKAEAWGRKTIKIRIIN
ncbi:G5 and 3D domain-containing protein [Fictibacillus phosphorivorans]|uniref:G5 and 3D domain-containing protein n=1 Tax=Fictibacillus phosphorivorans TaxID=1221500 RepID=UPI00203F9CB1|nr:G5 and 3D domain-containing protein [Fictibacillus phosphorivorans]MCM3719890.1 ubiquitin-like domain-containing protein [Fictibacillus phosphorivorans]MCM3777580.1 ubiquitin-like domain-containing protein [Fictibacillus phosphorivorans]